VLDLMRAGDQVLDTREPGEFAAAHLTGSINVGLDGQFATWAGSVLRGTAPIVVIAEAGRERESAMRLGRIGFDRVAGYLTDGLRAIEARPDLLSSTTRLSPGVAAQRLSSPAPPLVLDVRSAREHDAKRIPGAISVPLNHLSERAPALPSDRAILVHCAGGYRSSIAASILQRLGFTNVTELAGGIAAWQASGLQTEPL
jgi:rhodanese-related sulfurtransferase